MENVHISPLNKILVSLFILNLWFIIIYNQCLLLMIFLRDTQRIFISDESRAN